MIKFIFEQTNSTEKSWKNKEIVYADSQEKAEQKLVEMGKNIAEYSLLSHKEAILGLDFLKEGTILVDKTEDSDLWGDSGTEKISKYLFNDGFLLVDIERSTEGWTESIQYLHTSHLETFLLKIDEKVIYCNGTNGGIDPSIEKAQAQRFAMINEYENKFPVQKSSTKESFDNAAYTAQTAYLEKLNTSGY